MAHASGVTRSPLSCTVTEKVCVFAFSAEVEVEPEVEEDEERADAFDNEYEGKGGFDDSLSSHRTPRVEGVTKPLLVLLLLLLLLEAVAGAFPASSASLM